MGTAGIRIILGSEGARADGTEQGGPVQVRPRGADGSHGQGQLLVCYLDTFIRKPEVEGTPRKAIQIQISLKCYTP